MLVSPNLTKALCGRRRVRGRPKHTLVQNLWYISTGKQQLCVVKKTVWMGRFAGLIIMLPRKIKHILEVNYT